MRRGEIWWASLPAPSGSGPDYGRPVIVAIVTSNVALAEAPGNVRVSRSDSGLSAVSVVNVSQVLTIDRGLLTQKIRSVPALVLHQVEEGLRLVLGL